MQTRDVIVIGASLGGVEALTSLAAKLPRDLDAAVCVVQHTHDSSPGLLAAILTRSGPLPAVTAEDGMAAERGRIHVAPPGRHMLLTAAGIRVAFGPRENRSRPAIDPLFRTAAVHYGSRVIGVILTGLLDDGAAGLLAVQRCGGVPLVQALGDAPYPDMPRAALSAATDAREVPLEELGAMLGRLSAEAAPEPPEPPEPLKIEALLTERPMDHEDWGVVPSRSTDFTCPECRGAIREIEDVGVRRYRCRVGHAYTRETLVSAKDQAVEEALWLALQTLQERAQMLGTMAERDRRRGWERSASNIDGRAEEARAHAERLREFISAAER